MKIQPLNEQVAIARSDERKTAGGIIIPDNAKDKPLEGVVVAVGSEAKEVKIDNKVLFPNWTGSEVKVGADEYLIIKESDIIAIIEED